MIVCRYFIMLLLFSCMGWIYESIYRTIATGKWYNTGFLNGPVCPIYGVGAMIMTILCEWCEARGITMSVLTMFLVSFFGSIILEFSTSLILEKLFHAYWWDYSKVPLNIQGRICLPASLGFGLAGLLIAKVLVPFAQWCVSFLPPLAMEFVALVLMALLAMDLTLTVTALTDFDRKVAEVEARFNEQMERVVPERAIQNISSFSKGAIARVKGLKKIPSKKRQSKIREDLLRAVVNWKKGNVEDRGE